MQNLETDEMLTKVAYYIAQHSSKKVVQEAGKKLKGASGSALHEKVKVINVPEIPAGFKFKYPIAETTSRLNPVPKSWEPPHESLKKHIPKFNIGQHVRIQELLNSPSAYYDQLLTVGGWARTVRSAQNNTIVFIELSDGSGFKSLQVLVEKSVDNFDKVLKANTGYSFKITGLLVKSPAQGQPIEMVVREHPGHRVEITGEANPLEYPMAKGYQTPETLREKAHLRPRSHFIGAIARIRNNLAYATNIFFQSNGCLLIHTPLITASDCEGAGEMFQVTTILPKDGKVKDIPKDKKGENIEYSTDFFKRPAMLTVSGQLAVENYCCALSNVYTFGPTFRAENSNTSRHLAEFWMIEPELAFADLYDNMDCAEAYVKYALKYVLENNKDDLQFLDDKVHKGLIAYLNEISGADFVRCSYTEAIEMLEHAQGLGAKFVNQVKWGIDLGSEHERFLAEKVFKKPVFLYNYPKDIKAFYMKVTEDGKCVRAMDMLIPQIGELIGGSQREENYDVLAQRIKECGLNIDDYWWYMDLRNLYRYGTVPHSGFGLGFERLVMMATGVENIRDVIPYPRYPGNADF